MVCTFVGYDVRGRWLAKKMISEKNEKWPWRNPIKVAYSENDSIRLKFLDGALLYLDQGCTT